MKSSTILVWVVLVLGAGGLALWGFGRQPQALPGATATESTSALAAGKTFYNFGTISMKNGLVEKTFVIENPTPGDILVRRIETSCMCTTAFISTESGEKGPFAMPGMGYVPPANETIPAGGSMKLKVVYDPNAHGPAGVGAIDRFVTVTDERGGTLRFEIKALVTP